MSGTPTSLYDVIVVGAGPGGSAAAGRLARQGAKALLLDKQQFPRDKTCGDALSPTGVRICRELGIGSVLERHGQPAHELVFVAPDGRIVQTDIPQEPGAAEPARVIPRLVLDDQLRQAAVDAGADFHGRFWVRDVQQHADRVEVVGEADGRVLRRRGRVAVLAVGANLKLLRTLGLMRGGRGFSVAARAYFEGVPHGSDQLRFHFDGVPLPGYGWVFPTVGGGANVGVGLFGRASRAPVTAAVALRDFLAHPPLRSFLGEAVQVSPMKGFPLRNDFHRSRLVRGHLLLVGESAGLVNPFTGEGIDYALESGVLASQTLGRFLSGELAAGSALRRYELAMRARFQRYFQLTTLMRSVYMNRPALNALGRACIRWPELLKLLVEVQLGRQQPWRAFTPRVALWMLRGLAMRVPPAPLARGVG